MEPCIHDSIGRWCERWDSNPHGITTRTSNVLVYHSNTLANMLKYYNYGSPICQYSFCKKHVPFPMYSYYFTVFCSSPQRSAALRRKESCPVHQETELATDRFLVSPLPQEPAGDRFSHPIVLPEGLSKESD